LLVAIVPTRPGFAHERGSAAVWMLRSIVNGVASLISAMSLAGWPKPVSSSKSG
jgi:hypothetical protein